MVADKSEHFDVIIIGAGLVGLATAYHFKLSQPDKSILIVEKESTVASHQSGHNSGVIHSGIYYKPNSLKAQNCMAGYKSLLNFVKKYSISHDVCGKLIVATSEEEIPILKKILSNGQTNGLKDLEWLNGEQIKEREPHVSGIAAINVPQAGIVDYPEVARQLLHLYSAELGGQIALSEEVVSIKPDGNHYYVETNQRSYTASSIVSCAGLHSDRVMAMTEDEEDLRIIPFRGEYYKLRPEKEYLVNNLIYPVPDPNFPFLGLHFTRMIRGGIEAGPNAVLAFKREGYAFSNFSMKDTTDTLAWPGFWKIALKYGRTGLWEMYRSLSKETFTRSLQKMIPEIQKDDLISGGSGVRAQACDRDGILADDYRITVNGRIIHIQNAPSPAATSCLSIGQSISDRLEEIFNA